MLLYKSYNLNTTCYLKTFSEVWGWLALQN